MNTRTRTIATNTKRGLINELVFFECPECGDRPTGILKCNLYELLVELDARCTRGHKVSLYVPYGPKMVDEQTFWEYDNGKLSPWEAA
jgi:hypothetical protein